MYYLLRIAFAKKNKSVAIYPYAVRIYGHRCQVLTYLFTYHDVEDHVVSVLHAH